MTPSRWQKGWLEREIDFIASKFHLVSFCIHLCSLGAIMTIPVILSLVLAEMHFCQILASCSEDVITVWVSEKMV